MDFAVAPARSLSPTYHGALAAATPFGAGASKPSPEPMNQKLLLALAIACTGQVLYHLFQKAVATNANPVVALVVFYAVAAVLSLPLLWLFPLQEGLRASLRGMNWAVMGVGAAIVLIELGFLLAYRVGGELSTAFVLTSSAVAVLLLVLGSQLHGEVFTMAKAAGVVMCLGGVYLVSRA
jgi:drug/metabolite transporter (DMT)-like permease